ncbi:MAG: hypothetical protein U1G07_14435 [Verrucomicrobiota bacterium]
MKPVLSASRWLLWPLLTFIPLTAPPARGDRFSWESGVSSGAFNDPNSWHGPNYPAHTRFPGAADDASISGAPTVLVSGDQATRELVSGTAEFEISGSYTVQSLFGQGSPLTFRGTGLLDLHLWQLGTESIVDGLLADIMTLQPQSSSPPSELVIRNGASLTSQVLDTSQGGFKVVIDGLAASWTHSATLPFCQIVLRSGGSARLPATEGVYVDAEGNGSQLTTDGRFSGYGRIATGAKIRSAEGFHTGQFTTIETGGSWAVTGNFVNNGADMNILSGGSLVATEVRPGEFGAVTVVAGAGSKFEATGLLSYLGSVQVRQGGQLKAGRAQLDVGSVLAEDKGSFNVTGTLSANSGISILNGGTMSASEAFLGDIAGRFGSLTVRGAGSLAHVAGPLAIGQAGEGTLTIRDGGSVISATSGLGIFAGSRGQADVSGPNSSWEIISPTGGALLIGGAGSGTLTVSGGGNLIDSLASEVRLGSDAGGEGTLRLVDFASAANLRPTMMIVGRLGKGTIQIDSAAELETGTLLLGQSGLDNRVTVSGEGSILGVLNEMVVGDGGRGTFLLQGGAQGVVRRLVIGRRSQADNYVSLEGGGTALMGSERIDVGAEDGRGRLQLSNIAEARPAAGLSVGIYSGSNGELVIDRDAFIVTPQPAIIGGGAGSKALATVKGGGALHALHVLVFARPTGSATVEVAGSLSAIEAREDLQIGFTREPAGPTVFRGGSGAFVSAGTNVVIGRSGRLEIAGARIKVGSVEYPPESTLRVGPGGRLSGVGRVDGNVEVTNGGTLSPGASPGTLTIEGNYVQTDGRLEMEVAGPAADSQYDVLNITGQATLSGTLAIAFTDAFAPRNGQQFALLKAGAGITGNFANVDIAGLAAGFNYTLTSDNSGGLTLTARNDGIATSPARLEITRSANNVDLSWPAAGNWRLETASSIPSGTWQPVPNVPVTAGDRFTLTLPATGPAVFYRLRQ